MDLDYGDGRGWMGYYLGGKKGGAGEGGVENIEGSWSNHGLGMYALRNY